MFRRHPDRFIILFLLLIAVGMLLPYLAQTDVLLWPRSRLGTDFMHYRWTSTEYIRRSLDENGQFPLWYGDVMGGLPMIGNLAVTMVFYPPYLIIALLPVPIGWGFALLAAFHFWLAGVGGYILSRHVMGVHRWAAFIGALAVMLTPRLSSNMVGDIGLTYAMCWAPLVLAWAWLTLERRSITYAILAGMGLAFQFLLHVQIFFFTGWFIGLTLIYLIAADILKRKKNVRIWEAHIGWLIIVGLVCIGLAAFNLLPFISYAPYISRASMTLDEANHYALPPGGVIFSILPIALKFPEWEAYVGLLPFMLAPLAVLNTRRRITGFWLMTVLFSVLFSLGKLTPLFHLLFYVVPGFNRIRVPPRMWYFAAIAAAMLMSLAIDALITRPAVELSKRQRIWLFRVSAFIILLTTAGRFFTRRPNEADWLLGFAASLGLILGLFAVYRWSQGRLSLARFGVLLAVSLCLDLLPLSAAFMTPRPIEKELRLPAVAKPLLDAPIEGYRLYSVRHEVTDPVAVKNHFQTVDGMNSFQFEPYVQLLTIASGCPLKGFAATLPACSSNEISKTAYRDAIPNPAVLGLLNVRYVISPQPISGEAWTLLKTDDEEQLYENEAVLPRAFAVGRVEVSEDIWQDLPGVDVQHTALVEEGKPLDHDFYVPAQIVDYSSNQIRIQVEMPDDGMLVVSEVWAPGWHAEDNGKSAEVVRANGALRGVYLSAGTHEITLHYMPTSFVIGLAISGITLIICTIILLIQLFR